MYIQDDDSNSIFKDNTPYKFKVQLNFPLTFEGSWKVSLCEISFSSKFRSKDTSDTIYIYSNICKESIVKCGEYSLLRRVKKNVKNSWQYIFDSPFYLPLKKTEFQDIEFVIKTDNDELASFLVAPLYLTLHFKYFPFNQTYESI